jgi:hypothetical protein
VAHRLLYAAKNGRESEEMMRRARILAGMAFLALGIGVLPGVWSAPAYAESIDDQIATAKTAADHEAIAKWYDDQAKEAEQKAEEHRKMGEAYKKEPGPFGMTKAHFHEHCEALARNYTAQAKEDRALAAEHREMAKKASAAK